MKLKDYIQGNKRGKEANRLEREALNDPFLEEALEGFETVTGDHTEIVDRLEKRFSKPAVAPQKKRNLFLYVSIAASILLLIGFGTSVLFKKDRQPMPIFAELRESQPATNKNVIPDEPPDSQPVQTEEAPQESPIADQVAEKVTPAPARPSIVSVADESITLPENVFAEAEMVSSSDLADNSVVEVETKASAEYSQGFALRAQEKQTIRRRVVDETGSPLIGVSIVAQGTVNGTVSGIDGVFNFQLPAGDSLRLVANYLGYESQVINPYDTNQTVILKPGNLALNEVMVVGYGKQRRLETTDSITGSKAGSSTQRAFGEKEFQTWIKEKANKNICDGKNISVKVSFFIDETGKPTKIECEKFSCEEAKKEVENLLSTSPVWTKRNRKIAITVKW